MTRQLRKVYVALFLGILLLLSLGSLKSFFDFHMPADSSLINGKWAKAFESHYDAEFPIKRLGTNVWAAVDYLLFGEGRPGVVIGRDDWLYSDEEFKPTAGGPQNMRDNWSLIRGVRDQLAAQKINLVLAIVPAKSRLYPEFIAARRPTAMHTRLYRQFHSDAQAAAIFAPDLLAPLQKAKMANGQVFLRTDSHWTPLGAEMAARQLGSRIRDANLLNTAPQLYLTEKGAAKPHMGDLTRFLPLDPLFAELLPAPDQLQQRSTHPAVQGDADNPDLFGDTQIPVALVGTSYSANPSWNFAGALRQALQSDLVNHAEDGRGPIVPMLKYLQSEEFKQTPPQLVIWEFPERYLPIADDLSDFDPQWVASLKAAGAPGERLANNSSDSSPSTTGAKH